jgi:hypothetical protein
MTGTPGTRVIDRAFIERLGRNIEQSANDHLPQASRDAAQASDLMTTAGQGGGLLVVLAFFFAAEYVEEAWRTKTGTAQTLNEAAQRIATRWRAVEEGYGGHGISV